MIILEECVKLQDRSTTLDAAIIVPSQPPFDRAASTEPFELNFHMQTIMSIVEMVEKYKMIL